VWLRSLSKPAFRALMYLQGVEDRSAVSTAELDAYVIYVGFDPTGDKSAPPKKSHKKPV